MLANRPADVKRLRKLPDGVGPQIYVKRDKADPQGAALSAIHYRS